MDCCHNRQHALGAENGKIANIPSSEFFLMLPACVLIWRNTVHILSYPGVTYDAKPDSSKLACVTFISYSLLSVGQLQGEITFQRVTYSFHFIIHAICVVCIYIRKSPPSFLASYMSEPPFKKRGCSCHSTCGSN